MASIPGSVRVAGFMAPTDDTDTYAVHDEIYGRGGWRTVVDITARDAITADRRRIGMAVRVLDGDGEGNPKFFTLSGGITNSDWVEDQFGGGTPVTYTNETAMPVDVGGWPAGSTFDTLTVQQMFDGLLYPYQYPTFDSFSISGQSTTIEVGDTIGTNKTFLWSTTNSDNVGVDSISLKHDKGDDGVVIIASGLANDGTEATSYPSSPIQKLFETSANFIVSGLNTNDEEFLRHFYVYWKWRLYYGESVTAGPLVEAEIEALRASGLTSSFATTYAFSAGGYKYISYPTAFGTAATFIDTGTGMNVPFEASYTVSVTNSFGAITTYRVHRSSNILGSAINIAIS